MRRAFSFRHPAAIALALCLALGGIAQGGWLAGTVDSAQSTERLEPVRDHAAVALTTRGPQVRVAHLHRPLVFGLKFSGLPTAAAPQVSALSAKHGLPLPRTRGVMPRSGRSPPQST